MSHLTGSIPSKILYSILFGLDGQENHFNFFRLLTLWTMGWSSVETMKYILNVFKVTSQIASPDLKRLHLKKNTKKHCKTFQTYKIATLNNHEIVDRSPLLSPH